MGRLLIKITVVQYLLIWNSQFENQRKQKTSDRDITMLSLRSSALTKKLPASEGEYFWNLSGWSGLYFGGCLIKAEVSCNYVLKLEMRDCIRQVLVSFLLKSTQFFQSFIFILLGELIHFSEFKFFCWKVWVYRIFHQTGQLLVRIFYTKFWQIFIPERDPASWNVGVALAAACILVLGTATSPIVQHALGTFAFLSCDEQRYK